MKKLLLTLICISTVVVAAPFAQNCNSYTQAGIFPLAAAPASNTNCPGSALNGTIIVSRPNNGIYPTNVNQTVFYTESPTGVFSRYESNGVWSAWH